MPASFGLRSRLFALLTWLESFRYLKFGLVGASGTVVNMLVLRLGQEVLFTGIADPHSRLYVSLALAITVATLNNFTWNRLWTWADRIRDMAELQALNNASDVSSRALLAQFGQYTAASLLGSALQYGLTLWMAQALHYMLANVIAIVIASVCNFLVNDRLTFGSK